MKGIKTPKVGISLLILVFTIIYLSVFSVLSLSTAMSSQNNTMNTIDYVKSYYNSDNISEKFLKQVNLDLGASREKNLEENEYWEDFRNTLGENQMVGESVIIKFWDQDEIAYEISINEEQSLLVRLKFKKYNDIDINGKNYSVEEWCVKQKTVSEIDQNIDVWSGKESL